MKLRYLQSTVVHSFLFFVVAKCTLSWKLGTYLVKNRLHLQMGTGEGQDGEPRVFVKCSYCTNFKSGMRLNMRILSKQFLALG